MKTNWEHQFGAPSAPASPGRVLAPACHPYRPVYNNYNNYNHFFVLTVPKVPMIPKGPAILILFPLSPSRAQASREDGSNPSSSPEKEFPSRYGGMRFPILVL